MEELLEIRKKVNWQQLEEFKSRLYNKMSKKEFLGAFMQTFLIQDVIGCSKEMYENDFYSACHRMVDSTSLVQAEIDFFHKIIDLKDKVSFVKKCQDVYGNTHNLENCTLGKLIKDCLSESQWVDIY